MSQTVSDNGVVHNEKDVQPEQESDRKRTESEGSNPENASPQIEFKPVVTLPLVEVKTLEEEEKELLKLRAKLYRYETAGEEPAEWKERGLGEVKFLQNPDTSVIRILMRREKTLKICANHNVTPAMKLSQHANNEKAFVWSTLGDFSDGEAKPETFCIRFGSVENAHKFKNAFEEAKSVASSIKSLYEKVDALHISDAESSSDDEESSADENPPDESPADGNSASESAADEKRTDENRVEEHHLTENGDKNVEKNCSNTENENKSECEPVNGAE